MCAYRRVSRADHAHNNARVHRFPAGSSAEILFSLPVCPLAP